ncbi:MAG: hypothetical protein ABRQ37_23015 [Candidatus Eremiobacterota bacterium]
MRRDEYLKKISDFKLKEEHVLQVLTLPFLLVGAADRRVSLQESMAMDEYEDRLKDALHLSDIEAPEGFFEHVTCKFEKDAFSYVDDVCELVNYRLALMDRDTKIKVKTILASGLHGIASASKEHSDDVSSIGDKEIDIITGIISSLNIE